MKKINLTNATYLQPQFKNLKIRWIHVGLDQQLNVELKGRRIMMNNTYKICSID